MKKRKLQSGKSMHQKLDKITESLSKMATKDELKGLESRLESKMATKDELKGLESRMATKDELKGLESRMATKDDLKNAMAKMITKDHFDHAVRMLVTKIEFDDFKEYLAENMYTKADHDKFLVMMDPLMLECRNAERVNKLTGKQLCDMDDKIASYDVRIKRLEEASDHK